MKYLFSLLFVMTALLQTTSAQRQLNELWSTDSVLRVPESVLYDLTQNLLFVSLIGSNPNANKDGQGCIAKLALDGKIIDTNWITGLNTPKGLGRFKNTLYVADGTEVAVIDIKKGVITKKIPVEGAVFLNDITIDAWGVVYVSDSRLNKIHRIEKGQVSLYLDNINNANGLLVVGEDLYALSAGELLKINAQKQITKIAGGMDKSTDGLVQVAEDEFIVSCWNGVIYDVYTNGRVILLKDFRPSKTNTADLGYHAKTKTLYVPTFWKKKVVAYNVTGLR
jgi:hypothetical protein